MSAMAKQQRGGTAVNLIAGAILAAAIAAGGSWWWANRGADERPKGPPEAITFAVAAAYPGSALVQLAEAKGFYSAEGLQVRIDAYPTGKASLDATLAGQADFATVADIPFMFAVLKGAPVAIVASMATTTGGEYGIVSRRDRGITDAAALKGRRIGVTAGTSGHFFVDALLVRRHVDTSTLRFVDVAPAKMPAALAAKEVDAIGTWEPYLSQVKEAAGANEITFGAEGIYDSPWLLTAMRENVQKRPEAVKRLLRALLRAERFLLEQPAEARALLAAVRKEDPARLEKLISPFRFNVRLGQSLLGALEDESRWALRNKLTSAEKVPNFLDHVYTEGLQSVNPNAVTIIR